MSGNSQIVLQLELQQTAILDRVPPEVEVFVVVEHDFQVAIMSEKAFRGMGYVDSKANGQRILCCDSDGYTVYSLLCVVISRLNSARILVICILVMH